MAVEINGSFFIDFIGLDQNLWAVQIPPMETTAVEEN